MQKQIKVSEFNREKHLVVLDRYGNGFSGHKASGILINEHHKFKSEGRYLITINFGVGECPLSFTSNDDLITVMDFDKDALIFGSYSLAWNWAVNVGACGLCHNQFEIIRSNKGAYQVKLSTGVIVDKIYADVLKSMSCEDLYAIPEIV